MFDKLLALKMTVERMCVLDAEDIQEADPGCVNGPAHRETKLTNVANDVADVTVESVRKSVALL